MPTKTEMKNRARALRKDATLPELTLWHHLRNRRLKGYKFHRQYVIGSYIADFICLEKKIIVELDGSQHADAVQYDEERTVYLNARGFQVLRYWNPDVLNRTKSVLDDIEASLTSHA